MNKIIYNELSKVTSTELEFDTNTTHLVIPKTVKISSGSLKKGKTYIIELSDSLLNPDDSSTLASNWNNGQTPKYKQYIVEVLDNMAKMVKVNGVAVGNQGSAFYGWLPTDQFTVINAL